LVLPVFLFNLFQTIIAINPNNARIPETATTATHVLTLPEMLKIILKEKTFPFKM
jgi:hypothetical protein